MKLRQLGRGVSLTFAALAGLSVALATGVGVAGADNVVRAKQAVLISDDITNNVTHVAHAAGVSGGTVPGAPGAGDVDSAAGFDDGSNPNKDAGGGTSNVTVGGTDNPNKAGK